MSEGSVARDLSSETDAEGGSVAQWQSTRQTCRRPGFLSFALWKEGRVYSAEMLTERVVLPKSLKFSLFSCKIAIIIITCSSTWLRLPLHFMQSQKNKKQKNPEAWKHCTATAGCPVTFICLDRPMTHYRIPHIGNGFIVQGSSLLINIKHIDLRKTSYICPNIKLPEMICFKMKENWDM